VTLAIWFRVPQGLFSVVFADPDWWLLSQEKGTKKHDDHRWLVGWLIH
jgi:hypothetical protein